jgi:hypothetical protein
VKQVALSGKLTVYSLFTYPIYGYELPLNYLGNDPSLSGMAAAGPLSASGIVGLADLRRGFALYL